MIGAWIFAILIALFAIFHLLLSISKYKVFVINAVSMAVIFVFGFAMWCFLNANTHSDATLFTVVPEAAFKSFKMFAFGNDVEAFYEIANYPGADLEAQTAIYKTSIVLCRYVSQIGAFAVISTSIVTSSFYTFKIFMSNFSKTLENLLPRPGKSSYSFSYNFVFTDLPYEQVKPFLERIRNNKRSALKVIVPKYVASTLYGTELMELLKFNMYNVIKENNGPYVLSKFAMLKFRKTVNFYSLYEKDMDNLAFADNATKFLNMKRFGVPLKNNANFNFYVSIQDEKLNNITNYLQKTNGRVRLVNEYDWIASKFVFENPVTRFVNSDSNNFIDVFDNLKSFNVKFIGYDKLVNSLADKMLLAYQFPSDKTFVNYQFVGKDAEENLNSYIKRFQCLDEVYKNDKYYESFDFSKQFTSKTLDVAEDSELMKFAKGLVEEVLKNVDENGVFSSRNLVFISLGDKQTNMNIAIKLRQFVKNFAEACDGEILKFKEKELDGVEPLKKLKRKVYKNIIIYPYIDDNDYMLPGNELFELITNKYIEEIKGDEFKNIDGLDRAYYFNAIREAFAGKFKNNYTSLRAFIFDSSFDLYSKKSFSKPIMKLGDSRIHYLLKEYKKAAFYFEECPIVVFGRGSYIGDELDETILYLSKMVNRTYNSDNIKDVSQMENAWNYLSYPMQKANIDSVLTFPFRLGIIGNKFFIDETRAIPGYLSLKENKRQKFFDSCSVDQKINIIDFNYYRENSISIRKECGYLSLKDALDTNKDFFLPLLSDKFKGSLEGKELNSLTIPQYFYDFYGNDYDKYLKGTHEDNGVILDLLSDYYALYFLSRLNDRLIALRKMEHNRWYLSNALCGVVPRAKNNVTYNINNNKSKDRVRLLCLTSNKGLEELQKDTMCKMIESGYIFRKVEDGKEILYKGESIKDFAFDIENDSLDLAKSKLKPLYDIFKLIFENDILQYDTINNCLLDEINDYTSKSKINEIHKQAHKKYFFSVRENTFNKD